MAIVFIVLAILFEFIDYHYVHHTDLSDVSLDNLEIGMTVNDDELEKYGHFKTVESAYYHELRMYTDLSIDRDSNDVIRYLATHSEELWTDQGIRVGDHYEKVKETYGPNYYIRDEQSMTVLGYRDKEKGIELEFYSIDWEAKGVITEISITHREHY